MTSPPPPAVRLDHVHKAFGDHTVLRDVSFDVVPGRACCILGRSGTGKSVTLKHIIGLMHPDRGTVFVHGEDVGRLDPPRMAKLRRGMGFLFQNAALFDSISVGENVAFPLRRHTDLPENEILERARQKLADVGLEAAFDRMPGDLSGGMKKRAGLARAMALDPSILLADEPSAGLDPITAAEIDDLLLERKKAGTTLVVVTHNIPSARVLGDELLVLHEGRLLAQGTAAELEHHDHPVVRAFLHAEGTGG